MNCLICKTPLNSQEVATYRDRCEDCWASGPVRGISASGAKTAATIPARRDKFLAIIRRSSRKLP